MNLEFSIKSINAGWFVVEFTVDKIKSVITNSAYLGNDATKILLSNLCRMFESEKCERWLCWHDEPGAYIWRFVKVDIELELKIGDSLKDSWKLACEGSYLSDEKIFLEILFVKVNFLKFAKKIRNEFSKYSYGENLIFYENQWGTFPFIELDLLREKISESRT